MRSLMTPLIPLATVSFLATAAAILYPQPVAATVLSPLTVAVPAIQNDDAADADPADKAFAPLRKQFGVLTRSLRNKGGMAAEDRPIVESLRDRIAAFHAQHPEHSPSLAAELQLSMWLEDDDRVDILFEQLIALNPDEVEYGMAWSRFAAREGDQDRVNRVYERLFELYPEAVQLRITRARTLRDTSRFAEAIEVLNQVELDPTEHAQGLMIKADALFAEHRFQEAIDVLDTISEDALAASRSLTGQVENLRSNAETYIELWREEQELRSAEAAANDLPRVELVTEKGTIILELFEDHAPNHVANFITLAESGFYNETKIHRVEPESLIQGGDPNTRPGASGAPGQGGPGYRIAAEYTREDHRKHFNDTLAMARTSQPDSAGSQFYITTRPMPQYNGQYTVFGRVLEGREIVRQIEVNDVIEAVNVLRKRDQEYTVEKVNQQAINRPAPTPTPTPSAPDAEESAEPEGSEEAATETPDESEE